MASPLRLALGLLVILAPLSTAAAVDSIELHFDDARTYGDSIAQKLEHAHQSGNWHPRLSLHADVVSDQASTQQEAELAIRVREPLQAVTPATILREYGGPERRAGQLSNTILVADAEAGEGGTIALLSVDGATGEVDGVVQKPGGEKMKFVQRKGERARAYKDKEFVPPKWECGVGKERRSEGGSGRNLLYDHGHATNSHVDGHSHSHHNHDGDHHHHHDHSHHFHGDDAEEALAHIRDGLRGSNVRLGERRKLDDGMDGYHYQIDLFVEVDKFLVNLNGGIFEPNTVEYVNTIVTGANAIYEPEIDTHINVVAIQLTDHYDDITGNDATVEAVLKMQQIYGSADGIEDDWHTEGINLHHALLGNPMGGGVAFIGVVCNSEGGFGLSAELQGTFKSIDSATVWDLVVFTHELGHNFNSLHTHTTALSVIPGYDPVIDNCTPSFSGMQCPSELPLEGSATIMSYCHLCNGGLPNIEYTFGGQFTGSGSRGDIDSYDNFPLQGNVSYEARRVNVVMWNHISTRGTCAEAPGVTNTPTTSPSEKPTAMTNSPTGAPTNAPTLSPIADDDIESGPRIEMTIPASLTTTLSDLAAIVPDFQKPSAREANQNPSVEAALRKTIKDVAEGGLDRATQKVQKVVILDTIVIEQGPIPRIRERAHRGDRALADDRGPLTGRRLEGFLEVEYELILVEKCKGEGGGKSSCEDHNTTMQYDVTTHMNLEAENGGFTSELQANAAACGSDCNAIASASVEVLGFDLDNVDIVPIEPTDPPMTPSPTPKPSKKTTEKPSNERKRSSKGGKANGKAGHNDKARKSAKGNNAARKRRRKHADPAADLPDGSSSVSDETRT